MLLISRNLISRYTSVQTTQIPQSEMPEFQLLFFNWVCVRERANKIDKTAVIQKTPRETGRQGKIKCDRDSLEGFVGGLFLTLAHLKLRI